MADENGGYAVMRWLNDGNRLCVHSLKQVVDSKMPVDQYKVGMCGVSLYKGCPGKWNFRLLKLGGKKELSKWLDSNISSLTADTCISDRFCKGIADVADRICEVEGTADAMDRNCEENERKLKLEEEVRFLGKKYRKLEERVGKLATLASPQPSPQPSLQGSPPATPLPSQSVGKTKRQNNQQPTCTCTGSLDEDSLVKSLTGIVGDQNRLKHLCFQVFTRSELINSTRTGKKIFKCNDNVKPPVDPLKFDLLERIVLKTTSFDNNTFHTKFENLQKVLRRDDRKLL